MKIDLHVHPSQSADELALDRGDWVMMNHDFGMQWSIPIPEDIHRFRLHKINIRLADTKDTLKKSYLCFF